jgi:hypothetical protein
VSGLQCNYATRCADGPTYNVQDVFSSSCLTPAFADRNSSGVYHITGTDGSVLDCAGMYECCAGQSTQAASGIQYSYSGSYSTPVSLGWHC